MNINRVLSVNVMGALDKLLAQALASIVKENLGEKSFQKIESRLQERYSLNLLDAVKDFYILDATLREFFGPGADSLEEDFLSHLISLNTSVKGRGWLTIQNEELAKLILESYGDREKRLILDTAYKKPAPILDILDACDIPKSSGYRIINQLVDDGLLTEAGYSEESEGKKVVKYTSLFEKITIDIEIGGFVVKVLLKENVLNESQIVRILLRRK
jgi:hypothetical protein